MQSLCLLLFVTLPQPKVGTILAMGFDTSCGIDQYLIFLSSPLWLYSRPAFLSPQDVFVAKQQQSV
jgi:hypothetical protein